MKTISLAIPLTLASLALAQFPGLPECAQICANDALNSGIGNCGRDPGCICANKEFIGSISCCLLGKGNCNEADQSSAINFAQQLCTANGVSVPGTVSCSTATGGGASTTGGGGPVQTSTQTTTTPASDTSASPTDTGSMSSTSTSASANTQGTSQSTNFGPRQTAGPILGALGGIVAAVAML